MAGNEDGSAVIGVDLDVSDANKELGRLKKRIEKTVQDIADFSRKQDEAQKRQIAIDGGLDAKKARLQVLENKMRGVRASKRDSSEVQEIADLRYEIRALQADVNKAHNEEERYGRKLAEAKSLLNRQEEEAGGIQQKINEAEQARANILKSAGIADQRIVELNRELLKLKEQQSKLERSGLGFGYEEYA